MVHTGRNGFPIGGLQEVFSCGSVGGLPDAQLLDRFVSRREGAAFEAIVRRHGPMVWGVCRRVLCDHHDAEDAFQATFLVLARRAASIRPPEKLGHWLHGVANQAARKTRSTITARRAREKPVPDLPEPAGRPESHPDDLIPVLHQELGRMPPKYRVPIVLCDLEGRTHREAAGRLGWPIGTVSGRLSRARALLARRLSRRGLSLPASAIGALASRGLTAPERPAAHAGWLAPTVRDALDFATCTATAAQTIASARPAAIARRVLHVMFLTKLSYLGAAAGLGLILAVGGVSTLASSRPDDARSGVPAQGPAGRESPATGAAADDARGEAERLGRELVRMQAEYDRLSVALAALRSRIDAGREGLEALRSRSAARGDSSGTSPFPYAVPFERGATRFLDGDGVIVEEVRGTAPAFSPGHLYWIKGTYRLASHDRAMLAAYTTARESRYGVGAPFKPQMTQVERGSGSFTLFLPFAHDGWPHVSFYPADGGDSFGGHYFGTGDSVLERWWGSEGRSQRGH